MSLMTSQSLRSSVTKEKQKSIKTVEVKATKTEKRLCKLALLESLNQVMKGDIYK